MLAGCPNFIFFFDCLQNRDGYFSLALGPATAAHLNKQLALINIMY